MFCPRSVSSYLFRRSNAIGGPTGYPTILAALVLMLCPAAESAVYYVGAGMPYESPSEVAAVARDGDTVEIEAGTYPGDVAVWHQNNLTLRGVGGRAHLAADGRSAEGKAIWVIKGDNTVVENVEFSGAQVADRNGAGIRLEGANLTIRDCYFHHNENGLLTGGNPNSEVTIEHSVFAYNGYGDGYTHNMYVGRIAKFTLRFSYSHHADAGHLVKSRAEENYILFNRLVDGRDGNSSYLIDLPNPGQARIVGNELQQGEDAENWTMVRSVQDTVVLNNTFVNERGNGVFVYLSSRNSLVQNNLWVGNGNFDLAGATLTNNLHAEDDALVDPNRFDYRLSGTSPAIDRGKPVSVEFVVDAPRYEYEHVAKKAERVQRRAPDIGAHEYAQ
jgi:hypothetical protein